MSGVGVQWCQILQTKAEKVWCKVDGSILKPKQGPGISIMKWTTLLLDPTNLSKFFLYFCKMANLRYKKTIKSKLK